MEFLTAFTNLGAIGAGFWFLLKSQHKSNSKLTDIFIKKIDDIANSVRIMSMNVGKTFLTPSQTMDLFRSMLHEHIGKKLIYARDVLEHNHINERRCQIEKNLRNKFMSITMEESEKLSAFTSPAGDLGKILMGVDFDKFMKEVYIIFFNADMIDVKIEDLRILMQGYVNDMLTIIEDRIKNNL